MNSIANGGQTNLKGISLCLLTFKYVNASLERPTIVRQESGLNKIELQNSFQTEKQQANIRVLEKVFILLFSLNWLLVTVTNYLFETNGQFIAPAVVLNLFAFSFIVNALLFVSVSAIFGRSILKIWYSLKMIP